MYVNIEYAHGLIVTIYRFQNNEIEDLCKHYVLLAAFRNISETDPDFTSKRKDSR